MHKGTGDIKRLNDILLRRPHTSSLAPAGSYRAPSPSGRPQRSPAVLLAAPPSAHSSRYEEPYKYMLSLFHHLRPVDPCKND